MYHTYVVWMKWYCKLMHGVHRLCTESAAGLCGTSHVTTKQHLNTPLWWIFKNVLLMKRWQSIIKNHMQQEHSESAQEWKIALYKSDQQQYSHGKYSTIAADGWGVVNETVYLQQCIISSVHWCKLYCLCCLCLWLCGQYSVCDCYG